MHKRILIGFPLLAVALIFLGLWVANKSTTPPWRSELNRYISYQTHSSTKSITIQRVAQASQPWRFNADMGNATFGDCFYFHADYCYNLDETPPSPPLIFPPIQILSLSFPRGGDKALLSNPLTFPPEDIYCALLQTSIERHDTRWVVYIALHQDLYNAEWIIHESANSLSDPQLMNDLAKIGCSDLIKLDR